MGSATGPQEGDQDQGKVGGRAVAVVARRVGKAARARRASCVCRGMSDPEGCGVATASWSALPLHRFRPACAFSKNAGCLPATSFHGKALFRDLPDCYHFFT
jgi:hypothetical protein